MTQEEILDPEKFSAKSAKMDVNSRKKNSPPKPKSKSHKNSRPDSMRY